MFKEMKKLLESSEPNYQAIEQMDQLTASIMLKVETDLKRKCNDEWTVWLSEKRAKHIYCEYFTW